MILRPVGPDDVEVVFRWGNDPGTRAASFSSDVIPHETHLAWFANALEREDRHLYMVVEAVAPLGLVRFDVHPIEGADAEIGIQVAPEARGRGVGAQSLLLSVGAAQDLGLRRILARIRPSNRASLRLFERAGYRAGGQTTVARQAALMYFLDVPATASGP